MISLVGSVLELGFVKADSRGYMICRLLIEAICISNYFGTDIYKKVVDDLEPDEFEAGIVIQCKEEPQGSTQEAGGSASNSHGGLS